MKLSDKFKSFLGFSTYVSFALGGNLVLALFLYSIFKNKNKKALVAFLITWFYQIFYAKRTKLKNKIEDQN